jgi:methylated-DNA-[protein]-cysteine S-methyltransferase
MNFYIAHYTSPFGELIVAVDEDGNLVTLVLPNGHGRWQDEILENEYIVAEDVQRCAFVTSQLDDYFAGNRRTFDIPLRLEGTAFQKQVWTALRDIPYGSTTSYGKLAERIGNPAAVRAVGMANGMNPIPIIIPCHRVIGADGSLTGFGGGLELKAQLLKLEGVELGQMKQAFQQLALI